MTPTSYILGIISALLVLTIVVEMLRRGRLRERHAIWWFVAGAFALVAAVFPVTLEWTSELLGVAIPVNLVFFVSIAVLYFVCLQSSAELTELEAKTRVLAERIAILELDSEPRSDSDPPPAAAVADQE